MSKIKETIGKNCEMLFFLLPLKQKEINVWFFRKKSACSNIFSIFIQGKFEASSDVLYFLRIYISRQNEAESTNIFLVKWIRYLLFWRKSQLVKHKYFFLAFSIYPAVILLIYVLTVLATLIFLHVIQGRSLLLCESSYFLAIGLLAYGTHHARYILEPLLQQRQFL